jgi:hypothetical protein
VVVQGAPASDSSAKRLFSSSIFRFNSFRASANRASTDSNAYWMRILADCPPYTEFRLPQGIEYLVGYNIHYDWKVIGQPDIRRICVLALARHVYPGLDSYSQSAVL